MIYDFNLCAVLTVTGGKQNRRRAECEKALEEIQAVKKVLNRVAAILNFFIFFLLFLILLLI